MIMKTLTLREWQELDDVKIVEMLPPSFWKAKMNHSYYMILRDNHSCDFSSTQRGNTQSAGALADNSPKGQQNETNNRKPGSRFSHWFRGLGHKC